MTAKRPSKPSTPLSLLRPSAWSLSTRMMVGSFGVVAACLLAVLGRVEARSGEALLEELR